jgi:transcriptional regulator with XRE-family HTH domain
MSTKSPNPVDVHVGARVKLRRTMLGMSQTVLGEQLGITFQQIQKYEKGTNRIGASRLQAIANALSCSPAWFFEGAPGLVGSAPTPDPLFGLTAEAMKNAGEISTMRPDQVRSIAEVVRQIKGAAPALSDAA